jgi:hypothetical protein
VKELLDAFWRAVAYCLHPRVIVLSIAPLVIAGGATLALGWFFWDDAVAAMRAALDRWELLASFFAWLESIGASGLRTALAPLIVVALAVPVIVVASLLLVSLLMTPALVSLVAARRFPQLERRRGASWWQSAAWSLGCTVVALVALALSIPLWFVPPLVLVVPPLIWGWLTWRVMAFDALAEHASAGERRALMRERRWPLLGIGVVCGYLGAAPSLVWAFGALAIPLAPALAVLSIWIYTLVFAFSSLWFAHYALAALQRERAQVEVEVLPPLPAAPGAAPPPSLPE